MSMNLVFGPVPSKGLGRSLGANNIPPPKKCSYSCVHCQLGRTEELTVERRSFHDPSSIVRAISSRIEEVCGQLDYITFVPDGELTLDSLLGREARLIHDILDKPLAILTNSSLISKEDVREDLLEFDLVSLKIDSMTEEVWRRINRPHPSLSLAEVLEGVRAFVRDFSGRLLVETMLIEGGNTSSRELTSIASFLAEIEPVKAYLSIPIRPPAESWVKPPSEEKVLDAYEIFKSIIGAERAELLTGYEGAGFGLGKDPVRDLLAISSIHPIGLDYAHKILHERGLDPERVIEELLAWDELKLVHYSNNSFLVRRIRFQV